jgi:hypothetical protein
MLHRPIPKVRMKKEWEVYEATGLLPEEGNI